MCGPKLVPEGRVSQPSEYRNPLKPSAPVQPSVQPVTTTGHQTPNHMTWVCQSSVSISPISASLSHCLAVQVHSGYWAVFVITSSWSAFPPPCRTLAASRCFSKCARSLSRQPAFTTTYSCSPSTLHTGEKDWGERKTHLGAEESVAAGEPRDEQQHVAFRSAGRTAGPSKRTRFPPSIRVVASPTHPAPRSRVDTALPAKPLHPTDCHVPL